jgi:hypothetical protein
MRLPVISSLSVDDCLKEISVKSKKSSTVHQQSASPDYHHGSKYHRSLAHFPFVDDKGSVSDIFSQPLNDPKPNLREIGEAGRRSLVKHVFETMRFDRKGIRLSDLPEALEVSTNCFYFAFLTVIAQEVGVTLPLRLKKILEKTRSKNVAGPVESFNEYNDDSNEFSEYVEKYITFQQWKSIIRNFLRLQSEGKSFNSLSDMIAEIDNSRRDSNDNFGKNDYLRDYHNGDRSDGDSEEENKHQSEKLRPHSSGANEGHDEGDAWDFKHHQKNYFNNLRNVKSRLGGVITHDKKSYYHEKSRTDSSALSAVGKQRVDHLTRKIHPKPLKETFRPDQTVRNTENKRFMDLSSGRASSQIADSFLNGRIGKQISSSMNSDYDILAEDISAKEAEAYAMKLLG